MRRKKNIGEKVKAAIDKVEISAGLLHLVR